MSDIIDRSTLRVTRTVRRAEFVGRGIGTGGGGDPSTLATGALALAVSGVELGPAAIALFGVLAAAGAIEQYVQPHLGAYGLGGVVLPDNVFRPWEYADKVRRLTLEKIYGAQEGDKVWNAEWNQRAIDIDLRSRMP